MLSWIKWEFVKLINLWYDIDQSKSVSLDCSCAFPVVVKDFCACGGIIAWVISEDLSTVLVVADQGEWSCVVVWHSVNIHSTDRSCGRSVVGAGVAGVAGRCSIGGWRSIVITSGLTWTILLHVEGVAAEQQGDKKHEQRFGHLSI